MFNRLQNLPTPPGEDIPNGIFAERMDNIPRSFLREILKLASKPEIISFAGGAPNPDYFPLKELKQAAIKVFDEEGRSALQYSNTEGYLPLRQFIADRYKTNHGLKISPDEILITNGSQQGLDLIGKIFLDKGDGVLIERPSYLGAIQSLSAYQPEFFSADLNEDGIDLDQAEHILWENKIKLFYTVPDFQNPTGRTYSLEKRKALTEIVKYHDTIIVEDNPYGDIRFDKETLPSFKKFLPERTILLGSFSKIISPGIRLGWIAGRKEYMDKLIIAKQAADLHSNFLSQKILYTYLTKNNIDNHVSSLSKKYKIQRDCMLNLIRDHFSKEIQYTIPDGGLFIWLTLPSHCDAYKLIDKAIDQGVAFVPGSTFFLDGKGKNTIRLSFSNCHEKEMTKGMIKLASIINESIKKTNK
jgi:2-aminoadipate transaminase